MKWVTREHPKIDRIACPWLIARFIDERPEFLYVPADQALRVVGETGAIPFDIPGVELSHVGELCSFDAFLKKYQLTDPALGRLAPIVRGADTSRMDLAPQSAGLYAISRGLSQMFADDHEMLKVQANVDGWVLPPFMGLTSWVAFEAADDSAMLMGDTVVFEDEVNAAMSGARDGGLQVTALHNHFFFDQPKVYFMHIGGMGDERRLASAVKVMYERIAQVRVAHPVPASGLPGEIASPSNVSAAPIEQILGAKAQSKDGMVKVVVGRTVQMHGRNQHRCHPSAHDERDPTLGVSALLGQGQGRRPGRCCP
jgi:hypothetical protein